MAADDRPSITAEDLDKIRARQLANANLGVDPTSPLFLDAIPGSIFGDLEGPAALEHDEAYDLVDIVAAQTIPITATGEHLDDWAESLGLERRDEVPAAGTLTFTGTPGTVIPATTPVTTAAPVDADPITFTVDVGGVIPGGGAIGLEATAVVAGTTGNVPATSVTIPGTDINGLASVTNVSPMTGGADIESDELLSGRVVAALSGEVGSGTQADYRRWLLELPGIGFVTVVPAARGAGTVDVYITDLNNDPVPGALVTEAQEFLDPAAGHGQGLGRAPVGHDVLVLTPAGFAVAVVAVIDYAPGYSEDGTGGTRAIGPQIEAAIRRYIDSLGVGQDVVRSKVAAAIVDVAGGKGVDDYSGLTLNGSGAGATLAVPAGDVAFTSTVTLN